MTKFIISVSLGRGSTKRSIMAMVLTHVNVFFGIKDVLYDEMINALTI